jgi:hypothetical protein
LLPSFVLKAKRRVAGVPDLDFISSAADFLFPFGGLLIPTPELGHQFDPVAA